MNGKPYRAARLAATLRRQLWREHLGLLPAQDYDASAEPNARPPNVCLNKVLEGAEDEFVADPLSDSVWDTWTGQATVNTDMYRVLFRADPDDNIKTFEDYDKFYPRGSRKQGHLFDPYMPVAEVREKLDRIKGHLVWLPLEFLSEAEMAEPGLAVNQITEVSLSFFLFPFYPFHIFSPLVLFISPPFYFVLLSFRCTSARDLPIPTCVFARLRDNPVGWKVMLTSQ